MRGRFQIISVSFGLDAGLTGGQIFKGGISVRGFLFKKGEKKGKETFFNAQCGVSSFDMANDPAQYIEKMAGACMNVIIQEFKLRKIEVIEHA